MIILNGLNIFPAEIERVLESHPDVDCVAALGLPSQVHGQIPVAAVILRAGVSATTVELRGFVRASLGLRAPRRIIVLDSFPRNSQGKVLKRELLKLFQ
jgi:acyl-CoA synthetase (AMP-forming)/AMP-acid ligase II